MRKMLALFLLALVPALASAVPLTIIATPTDTVGPLRHNVFHDATGEGGMSGPINAWFDLDTTETSTWDPVTGILDLYVVLYDDSTLTNQIGYAHGQSNTLFGAGFGDFDDTSLGFITWTISDIFESFVGAVTMEFIDHAYPGDSSGNVPNTWVGNTVTLWGADGTHNGDGTFSGATKGVDMVFVVPEPPILMLMVLGLLGIAASVRRR